MRCPKCGNVRRIRYVKPRQKGKPRTNHKAKCNNCGFKGTVKP